MPTSKHRKKSGGKRRKFVSTDEPKTSARTIRIRPHRYAQLRDNPDFIALVKVGRVVNTVISCLKFMRDYMDDRSSSGRRQYHRAIFITGGYVFEGIRLVESLSPKFPNEPFFQKFRDIINRNYTNNKGILYALRHSVAFHLDSDDKSTKTALTNLRLSRYDLMSSETNSMIDFYFDFADTVDLNYLIDKFKDDRDEHEVALEIFEVVTSLVEQFGLAGSEFMNGLAGKMNLGDYLD